MLSPLLFMLVMEEATRECRVGGLWELLYADDLALTAETQEEVELMFGEWRRAEERIEGKLGKNKDGNWGGGGGCCEDGEVSVCGVWQWCWG